MASYHTFTSPRTTEPDDAALTALLRAADASAGVQHRPGSSVWTVKRTTDTPWTVPEIAAAQMAIDTAPVTSTSQTAQARIAAFPVELRALIFVLLDQINVLRAAQTPALAAIPPAQAIAAIINKAKTLS